MWEYDANTLHAPAVGEQHRRIPAPLVLLLTYAQQRFKKTVFPLEKHAVGMRTLFLSQGVLCEA